MTDKDLLDDIDLQFSKRLSSRQYFDTSQELHSLFEEYKSRFKRTCEDETFPASNVYDAPCVEKKVEKLCEEIEKAYKFYLTGNLLSTFKIFQDLFGKTANKISLEYDFPVTTLNAKKSWYRSRETYNNITEASDLFHVPFHQRGVIGTNRYSIPGYPCLYLSSSVNACWEELNRKDRISVSRFLQLEDIDAYDLRFFCTHEIHEKQIVKQLLIYPIKIACSLPTYNNKHKFVPEYIFSQLMLHYLLNQGNNQKASAILYTSTNYLDKQDEIKKGICDNLVIPVPNLGEFGYSKELSRKFSVSDPEHIDVDHKITGIFDKLQKKLNNKPLKQISL